MKGGGRTDSKCETCPSGIGSCASHLETNIMALGQGQHLYQPRLFFLLGRLYIVMRVYPRIPLADALDCQFFCFCTPMHLTYPILEPLEERVCAGNATQHAHVYPMGQLVLGSRIGRQEHAKGRPGGKATKQKHVVSQPGDAREKTLMPGRQGRSSFTTRVPPFHCLLPHFAVGALLHQAMWIMMWILLFPLPLARISLFCDLFGLVSISSLCKDIGVIVSCVPMALMGINMDACFLGI